MHEFHARSSLISHTWLSRIPGHLPMLSIAFIDRALPNFYCCDVFLDPPTTNHETRLTCFVRPQLNSLRASAVISVEPEHSTSKLWIPQCKSASHDDDVGLIFNHKSSKQNQDAWRRKQWNCGRRVALPDRGPHRRTQERRRAGNHKTKSSLNQSINGITELD